MTDFFQQQELARSASKRLVFLYVLAVLAVAVALHAALTFLWAVYISSSGDQPPPLDDVYFSCLFDPLVALCILGVTFAIILLTSLFKILQLRQGGAAVAKLMGATEVSPLTQNFKEKRLLNIVEEVAIASGVAMPRVFIMEEERGMNAFAAGYSSKDTAVAVTRGLLDTLNREELQAVIGHEFSHILNGDMRLNIRLIGVLHGIFALSIAGVALIQVARILFASRSNRRSRNGKDPTAAIALALVLIGVLAWIAGRLGAILGRLIQAIISRRRETLADASAVQFTRNPHALADALKLIGASGGRLKASNTMEVSHMLFASGLPSLFATHPPIVQRIRACEPSFDGDLSTARAELLKRRRADEPPPSQNTDPEDARLLRTLGTLATLDWLGDTNRQSLRDTLSAETCLLAALLSPDPAIRAKQLTLLPLRSPNDTDTPSLTSAWETRMKNWTASQRRQACELAVNTLRNQPPARLDQLFSAIDHLIAADNQTSPFEFALICMLRRRLHPAAATASARATPTSPQKLAPQISRVLSLIAGFETKSPETLAQLFHAGADALVPLTGPLAPLAGDDLRDLNAFDEALVQLQHLAPIIKRDFMLACQTVAKADHVITDVQDNLLFAIADAIDAVGWNTDSKLLASKP